VSEKGKNGFCLLGVFSSELEGVFIHSFYLLSVLVIAAPKRAGEGLG
jgi:hypothetical protein